MKITFIRPNMGEHRSADGIHPLGISVLIGLTPPDVEVEVFDERIEEIPLDLDTDLIAITAQTFTIQRAYAIADNYRLRGVPVVMGGYHPSFMPEEALVHADSVAIGEAEHLWQEIVADARAGKLKRTYQHAAAMDLSGITYDRSKFQGKKYNKIFPVEFNRGCRFDCDFCSVSAFNKRTYKSRPAADVIKEIEESNSKYVLVVDDNIFSDRENTIEFFKALIPLNIKWGCQISLDIAKDNELLKLMSKSGCIAALIGFESLSGENLKQMGKGANIKNYDYSDDISRIKDNGIMIYSSFVFGYDHDTIDSFDRTVDFALENKFYLANFNTLNPMPGTRLYERFKKEGRLVQENWWLDEQFKYGEIMFKPAQMTALELKEGAINARRKFYKYSSIMKRLSDKKANFSSLSHLALYLGTNIIARKEINTKIKQLTK